MAEKIATQTPDQKPPAAGLATIHHISFVVASVPQQGSEFAQSLGAEWNGEIIHDPLQHARVTFSYCGARNSPALELVEPDSEKSPLEKFLTRGGGLHHICHEVNSLDAQFRLCRYRGSLIARGNACLRSHSTGSHIAWVLYKTEIAGGIFGNGDEFSASMEASELVLAS